MAKLSSTTPSAQSLIDELDRLAIVERLGMTGAADAASSESSIALLNELKNVY